MTKHARQIQFSLIWLFVVMVVFAIVFAWLRWHYDRRHMHILQQTRLRQLVNIRDALFDYHNQHGHFPPPYTTDENGVPLHSWRILLLKYINVDLYNQYRFDERWNSLHNLSLSEQVVLHYGFEGTETDLVVVTGDNTMFPVGQRVSMHDITDDYRATIAVVETQNAKIHVLEPRDLEFDQMSFRINDDVEPSISSNLGDGALVLFSYWGYQLIPNDTSPDLIRAMLTRNGGEDVSFEDMPHR